MMPDSLSRTFFLMLALVSLPFTTAMAEGEHSVPLARQDTAPPAHAQSMPPEPDPEVTILRDNYAGAYSPSTLENLSKLYWRLGAFDIQDDMAVTNYLKINECEIYTDFVNDDLEWKDIVAATKQSIQSKQDTFPVNFQFVLGLHLGRYDTARGGFPIVDNTGFSDNKRIEVGSIDSAREICNDVAPVQDYPRKITVILSKPFSLDFIKLDEHVAQAYILRKKAEFASLKEDQRVQAYERDAYLRLRITFSQYNGNLDGNSRNPVAILYGTIDGYEIFEDTQQRRLMASVDLSKQAAAPEMSLPAEREPETHEEAGPSVTTVSSPVPPATGMGFAATPSP